MFARYINKGGSMTYNNTDLYSLLSLNDCDIDKDRTTFSVDKSGNITGYIYLNIKSRECPYCHSHSLNIHDRLIKRLYHPVLKGKNTILFLNQYKFLCRTCGKTSLQPNTLGDSSITTKGMLYLLNQFRNPRVTFLDASNDFFIPRTSIMTLFDNHIQIERHKLTEVLSFDENHLSGLTKTSYCCTIYDPISNTLLDLLDSRRKNVLEDYFSHVPVSERLNVKYVTMDMWETYKNISYKMFPKLEYIAVDSFHVIKHLNEAIDEIRKSIMNQYADRKDSDKAGIYWLLKTFHYFLKEDFDKIKYSCRPHSHFGYLHDKFEVLSHILNVSETLKAAYELKEEYREFNLVGTHEEAKVKIPEFIERFKAFPRQEFRDFGCMLANWETEIINSFIRVHGKRLSNGPMESLNGRIDKIMDDGCGYSNFGRFRNRVMFGLNKDEPITYNKKQ